MSKTLLVCDLDNTLYDWVAYFVPAFYAMVDIVVRITGCDQELLLDDFRTVHQRYHDSEYPFALLETQTVQDIFSGLTRQEIARRLDPAFHAFNAKRKQELRLYPGVREGLDEISRQGVKLVAHTESNLYAVADRLTRLEVTHYFARIYCRTRAPSQHPNPSAANKRLLSFPLDKVVELSHHQRKPDPTVLQEICRDEGVAPRDVAYVGDSMARDILMAKSAGVFAIWARYGSSHNASDYERLVRVTHWTPEDVAREREASERAKSIEPDWILERNFTEIVQALFTPPQLIQ